MPIWAWCFSCLVCRESIAWRASFRHFDVFEYPREDRFCGYTNLSPENGWWGNGVTGCLKLEMMRMRYSIVAQKTSALSRTFPVSLLAWILHHIFIPGGQDVVAANLMFRAFLSQLTIVLQFQSHEEIATFVTPAETAHLST